MSRPKTSANKPGVPLSVPSGVPSAAMSVPTPGTSDRARPSAPQQRASTNRGILSGLGSRQPKEAGEILAAVFKARHLEKKIEEYSAFPYWKEIVGEAIAQVAIPERIMAKKILIVRVIDSVWAQELAIRKPELLEKLAALQTGALIEDIRFVTGNPKDFPKS